MIGVSTDSTESHEGFARRNRLPFILLSDPDQTVHRLYTIPKMLGLFNARETFVIDRQGIIRHRFSSQIDMKKHVTEALAVLQAMPTR